MFRLTSQFLFKRFAAFHTPKPTFPILFNKNIIKTAPIYSYSSFQQSLHDYQEDFALLNNLSRQQLSQLTKTLEKYTQCEDLSLLTPNDTQGIFVILFQFAQIHSSQGNINKALRYLRETEEFCQKTDLKDSRLQAYCYFLHANLIRSNLSEQEHYLNEVDRICRLLAEDKDAQSLMLQGWGALALLYSEQKKYDKALETCNAVLQRIDDIDEHVLKSVLIHVYEAKAAVYQSRKDINKALEFWGKCLDAVIEFYGEGSEAYTIASKLTQFLSSQAPTHPKGLHYVEKKLKIALKAFSKDSQEVAVCYKQLGSLHEYHESLIEALTPYEEAARIFEKSPQDNREMLEIIYLHLVKIHCNLGDLKRASTFLAKWDHLLDTYVKDKETLAEKYTTRVDQLFGSNNTREMCEASEHKALEIYKSLGPQYHRKIQEIYLTLGLNTFSMQDYHKAHELFKESEKYIAGPEIDSFGFSLLYTYLGSTCMFLEKFDEALRYILKVINAKGKENIIDIGINYHNLAFLCERSGNQEQALELRKKVEEIDKLINRKDDIGVYPSKLKYKTA